MESGNRRLLKSGAAVKGTGESVGTVLLPKAGYADLFCLDTWSTTLVSTLKLPVRGLRPRICAGSVLGMDVESAESGAILEDTRPTNAKEASSDSLLMLMDRALEERVFWGEAESLAFGSSDEGNSV